jgi:hypothetical protein
MPHTEGLRIGNFAPKVCFSDTFTVARCLVQHPEDELFRYGVLRRLEVSVV